MSRWYFVAAAALAGCGRGDPAAVGSNAQVPAGFKDAAPAVQADAFAFRAGEDARQGPAAAGNAAPAAAMAPPAAMAANDRRVILTGTLALASRDFAADEAKVPKVVEQHGGYVADEQMQRQRGASPAGSWTIRVPAKSFDACFRALAAIASPETQRIASQDVGEEYVDVQARIAAKRKVEERLLEMLKDRKGDLKEVLELEAKLGAVREEFDRAQGRLAFLSKRVAHSTINLTMTERKEYVPPGAPDFHTRVAEAWRAGTSSLADFGAGLAVFAAGHAAWAPIYAGLLVVAAVAFRRWRPSLMALATGKAAPRE